MSAHQLQPITQLLGEVNQGAAAARERLWARVYDEMRRLAAQKLAGDGQRWRHQATTLVHEAYWRLVGSDGNGQAWTNRGHFFSAAAEAMRRILVDYARKERAAKRGGGAKPGGAAAVQFPCAPDAVQPDAGRPGIDGLADKKSAASGFDKIDHLALNEALDRLKQLDPRKAEIVQLRFYAGLTMDEIAAALGLGSRAVDSEWRMAKAWLHRELSGE